MSGLLDAAGALLSGVCVLHCLLLPLALTLLPVLQVSLLGEDSFHQLLLVFILPVSVVALSIGCRQHKGWPVFLLGAGGLAVLCFAASFGHSTLGMTGERLLTSAGGLLLVAAHWQNYRACREASCDHKDEHAH